MKVRIIMNLHFVTLWPPVTRFN